MSNFVDWKDGEEVGGFILAVVILGTALSGLSEAAWCIFSAVRADGRVDSCYTETVDSCPVTFRVVGHRAWRTDVVLSTAQTGAEAARLMKELCK